MQMVTNLGGLKANRSKKKRKKKSAAFSKRAKKGALEVVFFALTDSKVDKVLYHVTEDEKNKLCSVLISCRAST